MPATIYLNDVTCIDHAYIDDKGLIKGGSFLPSFEVTGNTENSESVVLDFSSAKKWIKSQIDDAMRGFDHKLWFINGYSKGTCSLQDSTLDPYYIIQTPTASLRVPVDAVKIFDAPIYSISEIGKALENYLNPYPGGDLTIKCLNSDDPVLPKHDGRYSMVKFNYVHGLKNSTSWGCQNIAHGHSSYLLVMDPSAKIPRIPKDIIFIFEENIIRETEESITLGYTTPRGSFTMVIEKEYYHCIKLECETTIENLVEYFDDFLTLQDFHYSRLWVSEGLQKGAVLTPNPKF